MEPWPPADPARRQTLAALLATWRGPGGRALARTVRQQVRPGSEVAVAGGGLLALHLAQAGARRVYILEADPLSAIARALAGSSGLGGRVRCLSPTGRRLRLPVDLIILLEATETTPAWALPLWAAAAWPRCGGPRTRVFPPWLGIAIAPTRDPILHGATAAFWRRGVAGVRLGSAARALLQTPILTRAARIDWLAPPVMVRYPLARPACLQVDAPFRVVRDGELTGFALLAAPADGGADLSLFQGQGLLLPLPEPTLAERGSVIRAKITWRPGREGGRWEWSWAVQVGDGAWKRGRRAHGTAKATGEDPATVRWRGEGGRHGSPGAGHPDS